MATATVQAGTQQQPDERERFLVLWLSNVSHGLNHFQNQMVAVMYPVIMAEFGLSSAQLGTITALRTIFGSWTQGAYGFLTPFMQRFQILGFANVILGLGTAITGWATGYWSFLAARCVASAGSSAQHPIGYSLLSSYFRETRGAILALNTSISQVGTMIAPLVAGYLVTVIGWRNVCFLFAGLSVLMGIGYFAFRDRARSTERTGGSGKAKLAQGMSSYMRVLKNRNLVLIALVFMAGGAGRGEVTPAYLGPHVVNDLGFELLMVGVLLFVMQVGSIAGPITLGWLSDRMSRKWVVQGSLFGSTLSSWWLAWQGAFLPLLLVNLFIYGALTSSRGTLTQALVADAASEDDQDAAFSVYFLLGFASTPFWAIVTGLIIDSWGFGVAWTVMGFSYFLAMAVMFFVKDDRAPKPAAA